MEATFQSVNFTADQKLINFIKKRLEKLELVNNGIVSQSVFLKVEPDQAKENKKAEIIVHLKGHELVVKKTANTFEKAADLCVVAMRKQLKKEKEKRKKIV